MNLTNASGGVIVMPDGKELADGNSVEVSETMAEASGVAALIKSGGLVDVKAAAKAKAEQEAQAEAESAAKAKAEQARK